MRIVLSLFSDKLVKYIPHWNDCDDYHCNCSVVASIATNNILYSTCTSVTYKSRLVFIPFSSLCNAMDKRWSESINLIHLFGNIQKLSDVVCYWRRHLSYFAYFCSSYTFSLFHFCATFVLVFLPVYSHFILSNHNSYESLHGYSRSDSRFYYSYHMTKHRECSFYSLQIFFVHWFVCDEMWYDGLFDSSHMLLTWNTAGMW